MSEESPIPTFSSNGHVVVDENFVLEIIFEKLIDTIRVPKEIFSNLCSVFNGSASVAIHEKRTLLVSVFYLQSG